MMREDYLAIGGIKKEILDKWFITDDTIQNIGESFLLDFIKSCESSKLFSEYNTQVIELASFWTLNGVDGIDEFLTELNGLETEILSMNPDTVFQEGVLYISENDHPHPTNIFDSMVLFFNLLK